MEYENIFSSQPNKRDFDTEPATKKNYELSKRNYLLMDKNLLALGKFVSECEIRHN